MAVSVIDRSDHAVVTAPLDRHRDRFEIGSIGKTMTAGALASLVGDGVVALDTPIGDVLDAGGNGDLRVVELARHTSGLPDLPPNRDSFTASADPFADFDEGQAELGLRQSVVANRGQVAYSNFAYALLGLLLTRVAGTTFEDLLRRCLWNPLAMNNTSVTGEQHPILNGFAGTQPAPHWHALLPGPGAVTSTIEDMERYLAGVLRPPITEVGEAIRASIDAELGWLPGPGGAIWHNGETAGFHAMLAADLLHDRGCVALSNNSALSDLDVVVARAAQATETFSS